MDVFVLLRLWFGLHDRVGRLAYGATGVGLMMLKYIVEALLIKVFAGSFFTPVDFVNPLLSIRSQAYATAPEWLGLVLVIWSLPFLWVALSMSVRRAADAGISPWIGLLVLIPLLNLVFMVAMCFPRSSSDAQWMPSPKATESARQVRSTMLGLLYSLVITLALTLVMIGVSVYGLGDYGVAVFLLTPALVGATSAYIHNRPNSQSTSSTMLVSFACIVVAGLALLLFAFEGLICILMAAPLAIPATCLGALIGKAIANSTRSQSRHLAGAIVLFPIVASVELLYRPDHEYEVMTSVQIDAPAAMVWDNVIDFPVLDEPVEWYFRMGISCPQRAHIEGRGVGATRYCEFTTGTFVEPITVWNAPRHLAFDVTDQPSPMFELTPYRHLHPPHLDGYLRSHRGEFRLVELPGGRTRLEGRTWYSSALFPQPYWTLWSDAIIHRIHRRVLRHIKTLSESTVRADDGGRSAEVLPQ